MPLRAPFMHGVLPSLGALPSVSLPRALVVNQILPAKCGFVLTAWKLLAVFH